MNPPPELSARELDATLAEFDSATDIEALHQTLSACARRLTAASAAAVLELGDGHVRVTSTNGEVAAPASNIDAPPEVVAVLSGPCEHVHPRSVQLLGHDDVWLWPVVSLGQVVASVAVFHPTRDAELALAAVSRYAGLRVAQFRDAEVRDGLLHERGAAIATFRRLADTDPLTGLPNRGGAFAVLHSLLGRERRAGVGLVMIDLNGFKDINDDYGHPAGDAVLSTVARRLRTVLRATDVAARLGGDEFILIIRDADDAALRHLIDRVGTTVAEPIALGDGTVHVEATCGYAIADAWATPQQLIAAADSHMYEGKRRNRPRALNLVEPAPEGAQ